MCLMLSRMETFLDLEYGLFLAFLRPNPCWTQMAPWRLLNASRLMAAVIHAG